MIFAIALFVVALLVWIYASLRLALDERNGRRSIAATDAHLKRASTFPWRLDRDDLR